VRGLVLSKATGHSHLDAVCDGSELS
jgi:hypothetical protein